MNVRCPQPTLLVILALACFRPMAIAQTASRPQSSGIAIEQVGVLAYPPSMTFEAIYSGEARVAISVDETGKLTDSLVTAYTNRAFADAALAAVKRWRYQPALVDGRPCAARSNIVFEFRDRGVIIQALPSAIARYAFFRMLDEHFVYQPCLLRDLDKIPVPAKVVPPLVSSIDASKEITVEFYIDEEGRVRMPAVAKESVDDVCAAAAVRAVEQWQFEPPLRRGRPVLVLAQQKFNFRPKP